MQDVLIPISVKTIDQVTVCNERALICFDEPTENYYQAPQLPQFFNTI